MRLNTLFKKFSEYKFTIFVLRAGIVYLFYYFIFEKEQVFSLWLNEQLLNHLFFISELLISSLNYDLFTGTDKIIGIVGSSGVVIGIPCNGLSLMALFSGFIIAFPANVKSKIKPLFFGILLIHFLNILRILMLILLSYYHPDWLQFNHDYTFTLSIYFVTFLMWMKWVKTQNSRGKNEV